MKFLNSFILRNKMSSIQAQINRLRMEESQVRNERNQVRQELQQIKNQWESTDRPRLLNMLFTPENQDSVRNATLSQILDKFKNEILNKAIENPTNLINRPLEECIKDFKILIEITE